MTRLATGAGWLLLTVFVGFYAYRVGLGIGGVRASRVCAEDVAEILAASDRALAACHTPCQIAPPLPPFEGPPLPIAPVVDCFQVDAGTRCCFRQHHDAQLGLVSYEPLGCVPTRRS